MDETLRLILNELRELKIGQQELKIDVSSLTEGQQELKKDVSSLTEGQQKLQKDVSSIKENLINRLGPYFEHIEKHIDESKDELKETIEDQQRVIDTLAARSIKHESEIKDFKTILKNQ